MHAYLQGIHCLQLWPTSVEVKHAKYESLRDYAAIKLSKAEVLDTKSGVTKVLKDTQEYGRLDRNEI